MRRVFAVALLALGLVARTGAAQSVSARVGGELTGFPGSIVLVPIAVDMSSAGGEKLGSYTAHITWDPSRLSACLGTYQYYSCVDSIHTGNFPPPAMNYDSAGGSLQFTAISPAGAGGLVTIARIPFVLRDTLGTPLNLSFSEMSAAGSFTNLLPLLSVTGATMCPARGRWGDIDRDDHANSRDALLTLSKVVGLPVDTIIDTLQTAPLVTDTTIFDTGLADVNADGLVQSVDALIILSYAVGIDIPGQRVLLLAPTTCGTGSARTLSIFPNAAQLVPNQALPLLLQARDTAGRLVTVSDAVWRSSDYDVASVDGDGVVTPRAPGTATITGEVGPGVRASAGITVVARRPNWFVDAHATGAAVQLGTAAFPFEHPTKPFYFLQAGDTVRVARGTYDFTNNAGQGDSPPIQGSGGAPSAMFTLGGDNVPLMSGAVLIGGTPGDTTTRPLFRAARYYGTRGLWLVGGRTVIKNIVLRDFDPAIELAGAQTVVLQDSRIEITSSGNYGDGIYSCSSKSVDTLRVDHSSFVGDSSGSAIYFGGCSSQLGAAVVDIRDSKIKNWGDGLYFYEVDSTSVVRSEISGSDGYGISLQQENVVHPSLYLAHSRVMANYYEAIRMDNARRLVMDSSYVLAIDDDAIDVSGGCGECSGDTVTQVYLRGDTIDMQADDYTWLGTYLGDTLVVDHTVVRFADTPNFYAYSNVDAKFGRVTNSQFLNAAQGTVFEFRGDHFLADSVQMTGCSQPVSGCDGADGFDIYASSSVLDAWILNSSFSKLAYPVYLGGGSRGIHEASGLSIDSASVGIQVGGDSSVVRNNVLSTIYGTGIQMQGYAYNRGPSTVANNTISCATPGGENPAYGISLSAYQVLLVEGNHIADPLCTNGIFVTQLNSGSVLKGNTLRQLSTAIYIATGDTTPVAIDSNVISGEGTGSGTGVGVYSGRVRLTRNSIGNGLYYGMYVYTTGYTQIASDSNAFTGNAAYAISSAYGDSVDATNNWWGDPAGPGPLTPGDSVNGVRIGTTPFLTAPPGSVPSFAPRIFAAAPLRAATTRRPTSALAAPVTRERVRAARPTPAPKRPRPSLHPAPPTRASRQ